MPLIWIALIVVVLLLVAAALILFLRTKNFGTKLTVVAQKELTAIDADRAASHLADVIRCETLSNEDPEKAKTEAFLALHRVLEKNFPHIHRQLEKQVLNGLNLVYRWAGSAPEMAPILFMAHQDVVPADPASLEQWKHPPFSGEIVEGVIWGRGTLDCKSQMIGVMEAVENLLEKGFQPERDVYLAFGQDEEVGGLCGQKWLAAHFKEKGMQFAAVIDEGGALMSNMVPGVKVPVALVGNCEKGYLTLAIKALGSGGHSSMPPKKTAIGQLSKGITRLVNNPVPSDLQRILPLFEGIGSQLPFFYRMAFANTWLFRSYLLRKLEADPKMAAIIRTTTAPTIIHGGVKDNILPSEATAWVNFRLAPGDTIEHVVEYVKYLVRDLDLEVAVAGDHPGEASPVSPVTTPAFGRLQTCIQQAFGDVAIAPFTMMGATDARYYAELSENVYRFAPVRMQAGQMDSVHNINEHISVAQFTEMVQFFGLLVESWSKASWVD